MSVRVTRTAKASWQGDLDGGGGRIGVGSGAYEGPFTLRARVEDVERSTNPEELIGAAHAGCFTMSLANLLTGVDGSEFARMAQQAKDTCPVSRALAGTEI